MKVKLGEVALKQNITLFDEEEQPDPSLITPRLIHNVTSLALDLVSDLLSRNPESSLDSVPKEKTVSKTVFKTVEFGIQLDKLKDMQNVARVERKECHRIIVEIEKLMYEMNSLLSTDELKIYEMTATFQEILDIYLRLPHRLKPIFDHCK